MDTASGQLMQSGGNFPNGSSEPVDGDNYEVVAFAEPADALCPGRSVATGASGCGIGEHSVRGDPCSRNSILLLIDGLLSSRDPEIGGDAHRVCNKKSPVFIPVSDCGEFELCCDTEK
jgi:hypothetical protein